MNTREKLISEIKQAGQYIVDNAENLLGDEKRYIGQMKLIVDFGPDRIATVTMQREHFVLEGLHD